MVRARKPTLADMPSTGYGDQAALMRSDAAVDSSGQTPFIAPDEVPNLNSPSARPDEPLTTGLPTGLGEGPEALGVMENDPTRTALRRMLIAAPSAEIARMLDWLDLQGR